MDLSSPIPIVLLCTVIVVVAAVAHESARRNRAPATLPYTWGYFVGYSSVILGLLITIAATMGMANRPAQSTEETQGATLALLWGAALTTSGVGIVSRRSWAWVLRICIWPNIISLIINILYYRKRKAELCVGETLTSIEPVVASTAPQNGASSSPIQLRDNTAGKLGLIGLVCAGVGAAVALALTVATAYMLAADHEALNEEKPEAVVVGLVFLLSGGAMVAGCVLSIASLLRRERKRWQPIAALATVAAVALLYVSGLFVEETAAETAVGPITTGTGFFVTNNGYLVTCRHVVENEGKLTVVTANGAAPAELIAVHNLLDLALLKIDADVRYLPINKSAELPLGATVATLGFPNVDVQGFEPKLTKGHLAALSGPQDDPAYMQLGMAIAPGYSGAAVVDEDGNAVGVATMILDEKVAANVSYATKGELVYLFLVDAARKMNLTDLSMPRPSARGGGPNMEQMREATALVISETES
jgi:S1-C subfamily serine protease